MKTLLVSIN